MEDENGEMTEPQYRVQMAQGGLNDDERTGIIGALEALPKASRRWMRICAHKNKTADFARFRR